MTANDYLNFIVDEIHSTVVATVDFIFIARYSKRSHFAVTLWNIYSQRWQRFVGFAFQSVYKVLDITFKIFTVLSFCHFIYAYCFIAV